MRSHAIYLGGACALAFVPAAALAQAAPGGGSDIKEPASRASSPQSVHANVLPPQDRVEEVVVTARRTEEALIKAPVTVTALTGKTIDSLGLKEFKELSDYIPSISINGGQDFNSRAGSRIIIRGMTPAVGSNASGVYRRRSRDIRSRRGNQRCGSRGGIARSTDRLLRPLDFRRAINYVTKTPDMDHFMGRVEANVDQRGSHDFSGQIEGPIIRDVLSARISASLLDTHGTYNNIADGSPLWRREDRHHIRRRPIHADEQAVHKPLRVHRAR